ncbi:hypothetical protein BHM03_00030700 [Ensete ventricosum]|nr:hypothetical protein BHM03_00030700 [Ensete ventricosum]
MKRDPISARSSRLESKTAGGTHTGNRSKRLLPQQLNPCRFQRKPRRRRRQCLEGSKEEKVAARTDHRDTERERSEGSPRVSRGQGHAPRCPPLLLRASCRKVQ